MREEKKHFGKETDLPLFVFSYPLKCNSRAPKDTVGTQPGPVNTFIALVCFRVRRSVFGKWLRRTDIHGGGSMLRRKNNYLGRGIGEGAEESRIRIESNSACTRASLRNSFS